MSLFVFILNKTLFKSILNRIIHQTFDQTSFIIYNINPQNTQITNLSNTTLFRFRPPNSMLKLYKRQINRSSNYSIGTNFGQSIFSCWKHRFQRQENTISRKFSIHLTINRCPLGRFRLTVAHDATLDGGIEET